MKCPYCGRLMIDARNGIRVTPSNPARLTRDHIRPRAWGGSGLENNIRLCCYECNNLRGNCGHCHAVLMMARGVARDEGVKVQTVLRWWALTALHQAAVAAGNLSVAGIRSD